MTAGFVCAAYVCVGVLTLIFFFSLLLLQLGSEADGRSPPPSRYVSPQLPRCADGWTLGDWLQGREEAKIEGKGFDLFHLAVSNWIQELWGTGVKINSSWSALMARRRAKTYSEQGAHWHHVLVYFLFFFFFFPAEACISAFCVLCLAVSKMGMVVKECSFSPRVPLSGFIAL